MSNRPQRERSSTFEVELKKIANKIVYLVNKNTIFKEGLYLNVDINEDIEEVKNA